MIVINYKKKYHQKIIHACAAALKAGKLVAYPTDTSYGLAVDATNIEAIKKLYKIKGRNFNKPVHVIPPSIAYAKKITRWDKTAAQLVKKFWPGALTLVLPVGKGLDPSLHRLSSATGFLGIRMPKNSIALDLAKYLGRPITTTSANVSGKPDCYSARQIMGQFKKKKFKPDIIIDFGKLPKRRPSSLVRISGHKIEILRLGPITSKQIFNSINVKDSL